MHRPILIALVLVSPLIAHAAVVPSLADAPVCICTASACRITGEVVDTQGRALFGTYVDVVNPWSRIPYTTLTTNEHGTYTGAVPVPVGAMVRERVVEMDSVSRAVRCTKQ